MNRLVRRGAVAAAVLLALVPATATAASPSAGFSAHGSVIGTVAAGNTVTVDLSIHHPKGWRSIQQVQVALVLRGVALDRFEFQPADFSLLVVGDGAPVAIGQPAVLHGKFFVVDTSRVSIDASGKDLGLTVPVRFSTDPPPPGAALFFSVSALGLGSNGFHPLTPPVKATKGFSWGTLGLAIAVALFAGGFVGNMVASNRRRQRGPSVYGAVVKRLEEERARR